MSWKKWFRYHPCTAIVILPVLGVYTLPKITMSLCPPRWYRWPKFGALAHGLMRTWIPGENNRVASLQSVVPTVSSSMSRVQRCSFMSGITPPLTHIQCNPSSFLLSAAYHVPVRPNSAEAGNRHAVVRNVWVKLFLCETQHTAPTIFPFIFYQRSELVRLVPQRPHVPHDDRWYSRSVSPLLRPPS